ncbi:hypothetical protein BKA24_001760 [Microbacterium marinum]|uniref:Uncharacterized protein n=1 Tax=Microbacterium marinum TaxID=421115 RepID=A0A7W7BSH7_9MICO|nr:hypothetical protein [Microbacterium marinum]MBB4667051.1 hypothetical protein [Microbacterium marinum]
MSTHTEPQTPEQIAAAVLAAHAIQPHWNRNGEQVAALLAEAVEAAREGYTAPEPKREPSQAEEIADRIARDIWANVDCDAPFGWINRENGDTAEDFDALADRLGTTPRELDDALTTADRFEADDDGLATDWPEDQEEPPTREQIMGDWVPASGMDYLADALDIRYVIAGHDRSYRDVEVCIGLGGPNVFIETAERHVSVHWGFSSAQRGLPSVFIEGLAEAAEELWGMGA